MKRLLISVIVHITALTALLGITTNAEAQTIRLGERIPDISVESEYGRSLEQIASSYVCLIFIHSDSAPCINAVNAIESIEEIHNEAIHKVLVTYEGVEDEHSIRNRITLRNYTLAFDNEQRTFDAFEVSYVPFGVIYDTRRNRIHWFGPLHQLNAQIITHIITQ